MPAAPDPTPPRDLLGDPLLAEAPIIEGYKVLDPAVLYSRLGQGAMGAVYRARHCKLDIDVAVKCLKPSLIAEDAGFIKRFHREARLAASIAHQNVVRVMDVQENSGLHYLIMEYVLGETLTERVRRKGPLSEQEALSILLGAATGLAEAHRQGIVHRDIKPDNLILSIDGRVKVADLGIAQATNPVDGRSASMQVSRIMGTPPYMPPEQWVTPHVSPAADVWALGATLYFMLAGRAGISGRDNDAIGKRIAEGDYPSLRGKRTNVRKAVHDLLELCVKRDLAHRLPNAAALLSALREIMPHAEEVALDAETKARLEKRVGVAPPSRETLARVRTAISKKTPNRETEPARDGPGALLADSPTMVAPPKGPSSTPENSTQPTRPSPEPGGDLTGRILGGKYRILRLLGEGGFGSVYEANDEMLGASVAIKVLTPAAAQQEDALKQFLGEARLLTTLDHPNIVRWITFDRTPGGLHYFVMEILKGSELSDVLDQVEQMPHRRVTNILLQILSALRAAHFMPDGGSLLHLDLKPRNVFVVKGEAEQVKVIDFGISQHVGAAARTAAGIGAETAATKKSTDLGATIATKVSALDKSWMVSKNGVNRARGGTLLYASPEHCKHLRGDPVIDPLDGRADLYSLGIMAFQMLTGRLPWVCRTESEAYKAHLELPAPPVSKFVKVPRGLEVFVARCLAKHRDERFADVKDAYEALYRVANPPSKWPLFAATGAVAAGLAVWQLWPDPPSDEVTVPTPLYFGPKQRTLDLAVGKLVPDLASEPVVWVADPQRDAEALAGWKARAELRDGEPHVQLEAPSGTPQLVGGQGYLRFGGEGRRQHSNQVRVVWLPHDACTFGEIGVRGAIGKAIDPVGADLAIEVRGKFDDIERVQVSMGGLTQNATLDANRSAETLSYRVPLQPFEFTEADDPKTVEFEVVLVDRAGNPVRQTHTCRIDPRPLEFVPRLDGVTRWGDGSYLIYPTSKPTLSWDPPGQQVQVTRITMRGEGGDLGVQFENAANPAGLTLGESAKPYSGELEIEASNAASVFHSTTARGSLTRTLRFRWETAPVELRMTPEVNGAPLTRSQQSESSLTNQSAIKLRLSRLTTVPVTVEIARNGDALPGVDLTQDAERTTDVLLSDEGRHELVVRGYRYYGRLERPDPEYTATLVVSLDRTPPQLALITQPTTIKGREPLDPTQPAAIFEIGDGSEEELRLEWELSGPGAPLKGSVRFPAGAPRQERLTWEQIGVSSQKPEDGRYTLTLTAFDAAANHSQVLTSASFDVARHGPVLVLDSPRASPWLAQSGNTFRVIVKAIDENGVATVECVARLQDQTKDSVSIPMHPTGGDDRNSDWVGEAAFPSAWSEKKVRVEWKGRDRFGNEGDAPLFSTTLDEFTVPRAPCIWLEVIGANAPAQPMRYVKNDPRYVFGGRNDDDEIALLGTFGLEGPRAALKCASQLTKVDDYYLDENEVTVADYGRFLANDYMQNTYWSDRDEAGGNGSPRTDRHKELLQRVAKAADPRLPMTGIDWYEAAAYARWAGKRLPTIVEWEYAVRGGTAYRPFSCARPGGQPLREINVAINPSAGGRPWAIDLPGTDTTPPGVSEGIRNLCGNVSEWTASRFDSDGRMFAAGAHFEYRTFHFRVVEPHDPVERLDTIGFRCATFASEDSLSLLQSRIRIHTTDPATTSKPR